LLEIRLSVWRNSERLVHQPHPESDMAEGAFKSCAIHKHIRRRDLIRDEIHEVRRLQKLQSALAGAAIGVGVGAGIGIAVDSAARSNEDQGLATAVFTLLGAVLGWMIARHTFLIKGETIYVAP
jgi:hypothetical protein